LQKLYHPNTQSSVLTWWLAFDHAGLSSLFTSAFLALLMNLPPETVIVSGDKSTLIMRPVFGEYYIARKLCKTTD